jgi:hypothetical protein
MIVLEALAILEAATLECKKRHVNTSEVKEALDFLEPHVRPEGAIPQFRNHLDGERDAELAERRSAASSPCHIPRPAVSVFPGLRPKVN